MQAHARRGESLSALKTMPTGREVALCAIVALVVLELQVAAFHDVRLDDAYITFRYGQNLADGAGLVFNPPDRVLGTTAPLHAVLAAIGYAAVGKRWLPDLMATLGCLGWTVQAVLVYALAREALGRAIAGFVALGIAVGVARSALYVPLEVNLVAAFGLLALLLAERRPVASGAALAVATLLRPDAAVLGIPLLWLARGRSSRYRLVITSLCLVLPWVLFAWLYYGSPIPKSFGAKVGANSFATYAAYVARRLPETVLPLGRAHFELGALPAPTIGLPVLASVWAIAAWGTCVVVARCGRALTALAAWGGLHMVAYLILRSNTAFAWHLYISALVFAIVVLVAISQTLKRLPSPVAIALGLATLACGSRNTIEFARTHAHTFWYGSRDGVYRQVAQVLQELARPGDAGEAEEVGTLAYWSGLRFYDHAGLVGPAFDHGRLLRHEAPDVRFSVMTQRAEVQAHLPFFGRVPPMAEFRYDGWHVWAADLRRP